MRHRLHGRKLGRTTAHRKALFRNQLTALFAHERIVTTLAKAKELRPLAERMVTAARTGELSARRRVERMVPDREVVRRLFDDIAPRFVDRPGGYTRILRLGRRHGDGAELAIIELVDFELTTKAEGEATKGKASLMDRAKGMFGGRKAAAGEAAAATADHAADEAADEAAAGEAPTAESADVAAEGEAADEPEAEAAEAGDEDAKGE